MNRRQFMHTSVLAAALIPQAGRSFEFLARSDMHVSCNLYTWYSYYNREGRDFYADLDAGLAEAAASGLDGIEPSLTSTGQVAEIASLLDRHGLEMRSVYVGSKLHDETEVRENIESVLAIAGRCKLLGTNIVVTNPNPIVWGSGQDKTDEQLRTQAAALDKLGSDLRKRDMTLAYHTHDSEFRASAREFHHMMQATDPQNVTFCLDVHWVYRGSSNSNVALFDVIEMYGERITELHIRQSKDHVWTETFGAGDIDYERLVEVLKRKGLRPHLVLEQAVEEGTPRTMSALEAHSVSQEEVRRVFAAAF